MKASLFSAARYVGPAEDVGWPVASTVYSEEAASYALNTALDQFEMADQLGFDWVSVAEHHYAPFSLTPNPMIMAAAMIPRVKRAKIAVLGSSIPINNPVRVAEEFAMLDTITNGRIIAGIFRGTPNEYVTYNINPAESRARFAEALALMKAAWSQTEPFGWLGEYYDYRAISLWPRIVQKPHPKLYMSGSSPESGEFAAENRIGLGFAVTNVPLASKGAAFYRERARHHGWEPEPDDIIYRVGIHVGRTDDEAIEDFQKAVGSTPRGSLTMSNRALESAVAQTGYYGRDIDSQRNRLMPGSLKERVDEGRILLGGPESVIKQIEQVRRDLGAGVLDLTITHQMGEKTVRSIELIAEKILPVIRAW